MEKVTLSDKMLNKHNKYVIFNKANAVNDRNILQNYKEVATGKIIAFFYLNIKCIRCVVLFLYINMNNIF